MARTYSPEFTTYKTVELEFTSTSWLRASSSGRDPEIVNMFYDRVSNENQTRDFVLKKRPGLSATSINFNKNSSTDRICGMFQDPNSGYIYWSVNNKVWRYNGSTVTSLGTMGGTTPTEPNSVGFCLFLKSTGARYLMINNGSQLWYHDVSGSSITQVTDADYPSGTKPHMVFLDGYLFVVKDGTGDIYNSDLDDPTAWTAGNYVTAEISPDFVNYITKVKNYLVAFGTEGIEFFYDAANTSGSPLGRNESYYKRVILTSYVANVNDTLFFIGRQPTGQIAFYKLDGNNLKDISPPWVNRILKDNVVLTEGSEFLKSYRVYPFTISGHNFLSISDSASTYTLIYDMDENFWYKWILGENSNSQINKWEGVVSGVTSTSNTFIALGGQTYITNIADTNYQDFNVNFKCSYITGDVTENTFNWKMCSRFGLHCDYPTTLATSYAQISWSDDDGQTWTTPRNLSVTTNNPYITQCGRFRTRNWKIEYEDNYPFRMWGASMDLNIGNI